MPDSTDGSGVQVQGAGGISVLVVDDTPDVRALVRINAGLDPRFGELHEAVDGADALRVAEAEPGIGAVSLDHQMPNGTGVEVLPRLRALLPQARIVLYTSDPLVRSQALAAGADAVLEKHIPIGGLMDRLAGDAPG